MKNLNLKSKSKPIKILEKTTITTILLLCYLLWSAQVDDDSFLFGNDINSKWRKNLSASKYGTTKEWFKIRHIYRWNVYDKKMLLEGRDYNNSKDFLVESLVYNKNWDVIKIIKYDM